MKTDMIEHLFSLDLDFGMRCWKSLTLPQYSELMKKLTSDQMSCRCDLLPCEAYGMQVPPDVQRRKSSIVRDIRNQQILSILETSPEYTVLYSLVAVMGTAGNILVLVTILKCVGTLNATNIFIASLSLSDLLVSCFSVPLKIQQDLDGYWDLGEVMCRFMFSLYYISLCCSALTVTVMGMERYVAVCHPLRAHVLGTPGRAKKLAAAVWLLSLVICSPLFVFIDYKPQFQRCYLNTFEDRVTDFFLFLWVIAYALPAVILSLAYSRTIYVLWQSLKKSSAMQNATGKSGSSGPVRADVKMRIQVIVMLVFLLIVYLITWGPFLTLRAFHIYGYEIWLMMKHGLSEHNVRQYRQYSRLLSYLGCAANPLLYVIFSRQMREGYKRALTCAYGKAYRKKGKTSQITLSSKVNSSVASTRE